MDEEHLFNLLKYSSSKELYIVTWNDILKILFCPFKVRVSSPTGRLMKDAEVWVDEVKISRDLITVFIIRGDAYYYYHFEILG